MTQAFRPTALVVEDDQIQLMMLTVLLQFADRTKVEEACECLELLTHRGFPGSSRSTLVEHPSG